jgi:chloramphenicol-sensitive protein RarD
LQKNANVCCAPDEFRTACRPSSRAYHATNVAMTEPTEPCSAAPADGDASPVHAQAAAHASARAGLAYALAAYLAWGFVPAYFKLLAHVSPLVVLCHRVVWSVLFLAVLIAVQRRGADVWACARRRPVILALLASTVFIAINWYVFIWAVSNGRVLQASLGYYINPLVNVMLGMVFLRERLRRWQAAGLTLAAAGVVVMAAFQGQLPWVSLALAFSFGLYALVRKTAAVGPLVGLTIETTLLLPVALVVLAGPKLGWFVPRAPAAAWGTRTYLLLALAGLVTAIPLLWFAAAARRLRLSTMGVLQYVSPTCQFLLAVFAYGEAFRWWHGVSFGLIWGALAIYTADSIRAYRQAQAEVGHAAKGGAMATALSEERHSSRPLAEILPQAAAR